mgnify:CR=1 FL=1
MISQPFCSKICAIQRARILIRIRDRDQGFLAGRIHGRDPMREVCRRSGHRFARSARIWRIAAPSTNRPAASTLTGDGSARSYAKESGDSRQHHAVDVMPVQGMAPGS